MTLAITLKHRSPADTKDSLGAQSVVGCVECDAALGPGWPLWGLHLTVALTYHAAHWLVSETRDIPALDSDDRRFGRRIGIVTDPPEPWHD